MQVLDDGGDSAAEYDCADEDMDGPDSVCIDDLILEQNRERVLSMKISKPVMTTQSKPIKPKKIARPTQFLKKLLFVPDQPKNRLNTQQQTRNRQLPHKHDLKVANSSASQASATRTLKPKSDSFADKTYLTTCKQSQSAKKKSGQKTFLRNHIKLDDVDLYEASPLSEYQMQRRDE